MGKHFLTKVECAVEVLSMFISICLQKCNEIRFRVLLNWDLVEINTVVKAVGKDSFST